MSFAETGMNPVRLKLVATVAPIAFLVAVTFTALFVVNDSVQSIPGFVTFVFIEGVAVVAFSFFVFSRIERLERQLVTQNQRRAALAGIATTAAESQQIDDLLSGTLDKVIELCAADAGVICVLESDGEELVASCYRGLSEEIATRVRRQKVGDEPIGTEVVRTGKPVVVDDLLNSPGVGEAVRSAGFQSSVSVPLKAEGDVVGVLALASRRQRAFPADQVALLGSVGSQIGLAVRNAALLSRSQQRNEELSALLKVGRATTSTLDIAVVLNEALRAALGASTADAAEMWLMSRDGDLSLGQRLGFSAAYATDVLRLGPGEGLPGIAAAARASAVSHDLARDARWARAELVAGGLQTYLALPLLSHGEVIAVFGLAAFSELALRSTSEQRLLEGIGEQIATAIENASLHQRVLDVAVVEERERIARELHDGLAQVLGYINTQTLAIRKLLSSGRTAEAESEIRSLEEAARRVYADVREGIVALSVSLSGAGGIVPALQAFIPRFSQMAGVATELVVEPAAETMPLAPSVELQLMRIVQEALSNVRKHAEAKTAIVRFSVVDTDLTVQIVDDGRGFQTSHPQPNGWPGFGLQSMRDRAASVGGQFAIHAEPGSGTTVTVRVPVARDGAKVLDARPHR